MSWLAVFLFIFGGVCIGLAIGLNAGFHKGRRYGQMESTHPDEITRAYIALDRMRANQCRCEDCHHDLALGHPSEYGFPSPETKTPT